MENNNQKIIIFKKGGKDLIDIIEEILANNGLKESSNDYIEKIRQKKNTLFDALYVSAKNLASGKIVETNFLSDIQQKLNISEQTAKNILKEIKEKFLVLVEVVSGDAYEIKEAAPNFKIETRQSIEPTPLPEKKEKNIESKTKSVAPVKKRVVKEKNEIISEQLKNPAEYTQPVQKKQNDSYREPIE